MNDKEWDTYIMKRRAMKKARISIKNYKRFQRT